MDSVNPLRVCAGGRDAPNSEAGSGCVSDARPTAQRAYLG